jgi:hypothetical protein
LKEGHDVWKSWQERYFVLDANERKITYYTDMSKKDIKGEYKFTPASTVDSSNANTSQQHLFVLTGRSAKGEGKSELFMSATSPEIKNKWITHIRKAIKGETFLLENAAQNVSDMYAKVEHEIKHDLGLKDDEPCCGCDFFNNIFQNEKDRVEGRGERDAEGCLNGICPM